MSQEKLEVGRLVRVKHDVNLKKDEILPDGFVYQIAESDHGQVVLVDRDSDRSKLSRSLALECLEVLPKKSAVIRMLCDLDNEEDYKGIELNFQWALTDRRGVSVTFARGCTPEEALLEKTDVYVIDYGGMGVMGAYDAVVDTLQGVMKLAQEKPNTLVVIWTSFTGKFYQAVVENEAGSLIEQPNVTYRDGASNWEADDDRAKFKQALDIWFGEAVLDEKFERIVKEETV